MSISIDFELYEQLKTLAALSRVVNLTLEDWLEVVGLGEMKRLTGIRNHNLP